MGLRVFVPVWNWIVCKCSLDPCNTCVLAYFEPFFRSSRLIRSQCSNFGFLFGSRNQKEIPILTSPGSTPRTTCGIRCTIASHRFDCDIYTTYSRWIKPKNATIASHRFDCYSSTFHSILCDLQKRFSLGLFPFSFGTPFSRRGFSSLRKGVPPKSPQRGVAKRLFMSFSSSLFFRNKEKRRRKSPF